MTILLATVAKHRRFTRADLRIKDASFGHGMTTPLESNVCPRGHPRSVWWGCLVLAVTACSPAAPPTPVADFARELTGEWQGTVGETKETVSFRPDGSFIAQLTPTGFISSTLL